MSRKPEGPRKFFAHTVKKIPDPFVSRIEVKVERISDSFPLGLDLASTVQNAGGNRNGGLLDCCGQLLDSRDKKTWMSA